MGKIVHIVLWKLKGPIANHEVAKEAISALYKVPGAEVMKLGPPLLDGRAKGFNWGLYSIFSSAEALQKYAVSEAHVKVVENNVKPNVEDLIAYDFELDE
ncbi:hypothetical protein I302_100175 [Kwoniella bestiolae CBS 10118]|uniref:Stress-response A/B barrel domain-containing protein n=1 Tax=Kwoniella bestiolae CBS 10118 TaxID=1296100 RepID=A0A1B9G4B6_9TREE|nr:hypothetical protein I302_03550 [Kwoniella bestiolae CBS 10118]OCF25875.1 hypothetical protein I302_03550 [Kwoniella bestiolae CBS 10118]